MNVHSEELKRVFNSSRNDKLCGKNKISAEKHKYAHSKLFEILSCLLFCMSMFIHGYIPEKMLISVIVHVVSYILKLQIISLYLFICLKKNW